MQLCCAPSFKLCLQQLGRKYELGRKKRNKGKKEEKGKEEEYRLPGTRKHRFVLLNFKCCFIYCFNKDRNEGSNIVSQRVPQWTAVVLASARQRHKNWEFKANATMSGWECAVI